MVEKYENTLNFDNSGWVDSSLPYISISSILGVLGEPFDSDNVAQKTYEKHFNNPESQYFQKTKSEILEMWEAKGAESRKYGQLLDDYIGTVLEGTEDDLEIYNLDNDVDGDERLSGLVTSFNDFLAFIKKEKPSWVYVTREKMLYYNLGDFNVGGRFDALFYDTATNKWIIIDWKSSGTIEKVANKWTKKLLGTAKDFYALNWYTYTMQLYLYKSALLNHYLPEGTTENDVEVYIVNLPGKNIPTCDKMFEIHPAAFIYNKDQMDKIFIFGYKKNALLAKKNA